MTRTGSCFDIFGRFRHNHCVHSSSFDRLNKSITHDCGASVAATSSNLNRSLQTTIGRQNTWSTITIISTIATTAPSSARWLCCRIASFMYEPSPGNR